MSHSQHWQNTALSQNIKYILFDKITTIATTALYFPRKYREVLEIQKHPDNLNRDVGYNVSRI